MRSLVSALGRAADQIDPCWKYTPIMGSAMTFRPYPFKNLGRILKTSCPMSEIAIYRQRPFHAEVGMAFSEGSKANR
jgi:hypothetical protein